jgi:hypothetical protein
VLKDIERNFVPVEGDGFDPYLRPDSKLPAIDKSRLNLDLYVGDERSRVKVPVTGEASLMIQYKNRAGVVSSFNAPDSQIEVVQLQGSNQEGYRVNTSLDWVAMFADQLLLIAQHPDNGVRRLVMPTLLAIRGFADAEEDAMKRYEQFAARAGLIFSAEERSWIRDIK